MKKLTGLLGMVLAGLVFAGTAVAGSVSAYVNPHNDGRGGHGAGMSLAVDVTSNVYASANYLDTNARHGGAKVFDARVGTSIPIAGKLSGLAEAGYGSVHGGDHNVVPVALGLKYDLAEKLALTGKGTRFFKDSTPGNKEHTQWTVGVDLGF